MDEEEEREAFFERSNYPALSAALGESAFDELVMLIADVAGALMGVEVHRTVEDSSPDSG